jgi:hypothetical protein
MGAGASDATTTTNTANSKSQKNNIPKKDRLGSANTMKEKNGAKNDAKKINAKGKNVKDNDVAVKSMFCCL